MSSAQFHQLMSAYDAVDAAFDAADALPTDGLCQSERVQVLERRERWRRRLPAGEHALLAELAYAPVEEIGGRPAHVLADRLRIYRRDARRRLEEAVDLAGRRALSGAPLAPKLQATAAGQAAGDISVGQVAIIREFLAQLPCWVDEATRGEAEATLAAIAARYRPDELKRFADWYATVLNPDGDFSDEHRARRRGVVIGRQQHDGMSAITGWLDPELRAGLDAVLAKLAAPGMCNPQDEMPSITGQPSPQALEGDDRSAAQRTHDALNTMVRAMLMSGELGSHQGLPVTITATVELKDLQAKAGMARTGGGTLLPVPTLIRMAAHAYNFCWSWTRPSPCSCTRAAPPGWPPPPNAWCSTPSSAAAPNRAATPRPIGAKCITPPQTGPPAVRPTSMTSPWPAGPTTAWSPTATGKPRNATTAPPNGYRPPNSTTANPAPTPPTTPNACSRRTTTTANRTNACDGWPAHPPARSPRALPLAR